MSCYQPFCSTDYIITHVEPGDAEWLLSLCRSQSGTGEDRFRLRKIMLPRCPVGVCHVFVLVLCLSAAEDFDWTKNDHGSFYYGTFPAGMSTQEVLNTTLSFLTVIMMDTLQLSSNSSIILAFCMLAS